MSLEVESVRHWQPPDRIKVHKDPRFAYRWIRKQDVETRLDEGYVLATKKEQADAECSSIDQAAHFRGLILMKMPKHMAVERAEYYVEKHNRRVRATATGASLQSEMDKANAAAGGELVTGQIGKTVINRGTATDDGLIHTSTETFDPKDTSEKDIKEMVEVKKEIHKDLKKARGRPKGS